MIEREGFSFYTRHPREPRTWIFVPDTWTLKVPRVTSADANPALCQRLFESAYLRGLKDALARRAREYAEANPDLCVPLPALSRGSRKFVALKGFDPAQLQSTYIPFASAHHVKADIGATLAQMAAKARAA